MKSTEDDYFDSEEFHELLSEYETAMNTGQPVFLDAEELTDIAEYYQYCNCDEQAEQALNLALDISPGSIAPLNYMIQVALDRGDIDQAREYLEQINDTDELDYIYDKAEIMLAEEHAEEANSYLREAFKNVSPEDYQDFVMDVADIFIDYNYPDIARQWLARGLQDTNDFKELSAQMLFQLGRYEESAKVWSELIDTDPYNIHYWNMLASTQFANEDYSNAIESCEYILAIDPNDLNGLMTKANTHFQMNNHQEALKYYQRFNKLKPDDEFTHTHMGITLVNMGRFKDAIQSLSKAVDLLPDDSPYLSEIYEQLAFAYNEEGLSDKALEMLDKIDEREDSDHVRTMVLRGYVYLKAGKLKQAQEIYRQAIAESKTPAHTLLRITVSLYENQYLKDAYRLFKKYFKMIDDNNDEGYAYMALCCYDLKKTSEFLYYLEIACKRNPQECRLALSHIFPKNVEPKDFYTYIHERLQK